MFNAPNPDDYVLAAPLRWQGILYKEESPLPKGMNAAAINRFLHRTPPLVKLKAGENGAEPNGAAVKPATSKKTSKKKATKKKRVSKKKKVSARR